jgi:hypothetical protein
MFKELTMPAKLTRILDPLCRIGPGGDYVRHYRPVVPTPSSAFRFKFFLFALIGGTALAIGMFGSPLFSIGLGAGILASAFFFSLKL